MKTLADLAEILRANPEGLTCAEIGAQLWGTTYRNPQSYCRPAGRLLKRAREQRLVTETFDCRNGKVLRLWIPRPLLLAQTP